jgi:hypothetical protein
MTFIGEPVREWEVEQPAIIPQEEPLEEEPVREEEKVEEEVEVPA